MSTPALELRDATKRFGGHTVVESVSISFRRGHCSAVIGPNGAGKTMLFNLITGVYPMTSGGLWIGGIEATNFPPRARMLLGVSRTFQNIRLIERMTVLENVMLGQHLRVSWPQRFLMPRALTRGSNLRTEAMEELDRAGLAHLANRRASSIAYGLRKQVELVRSLLARPQLLLLDEPAAGLNPVETGRLEAQLQEIILRGTTLIMVEHDMGFVKSLAENVIVLNFGRIIAQGGLDSLRSDRAVREAYLGSDEQDAA